MKICKECKIQKELSEFNNHKIMKDGKSTICRPCKNLKDQEAYLKNQETRKLKAKEYYNNNKEIILAKIDKPKKNQYRKEYYKLTKEYNKEYCSNYRRENVEEIAIQRKGYRLENKDKINSYRKEKIKTDPLFKLTLTVRKRNNEIFRQNRYTKSLKFAEYIGCTKEELFQHIEKQFQPGMTWENHGQVWHVDHIIPLAIANTEHQVYELSHYKNLQPLFAKDNLIKSSKLTTCWQKFQRDKNIELDKKEGFPFDLPVDQFVLAHEPITEEHRQFIKKYEWLGSVGFGVRWVFTARWNNNLAGVVMLSEPNGYQFGEQEALIQRGAVASWSPKNLNSKLVMFSCRWMVANTNKRYFVAYSDPEAGEIGTIYQACNFDYLGQNYGANYMYQLPEGKWVSARYFTRTSGMKKWAKELGVQWQKEWVKPNGFQIPEKVPQILKDYAKTKMESCPRKKQTSKGKYVLLLNYGKQKIKKTWTPEPYPKR